MGKKYHTRKNRNVKPEAPAQKKSVTSVSIQNNIYFYPALLTLMLVVFLAFSPSLNNAFTNWDDDKYVPENPLIKDLSAQGIKNIFSQIYFGQYHPLQLLSYAIEWHIAGDSPRLYHFDNVVFHMLNTFLVLLLIQAFTQNFPIAFITALLFGLSPMRVESVAWVAERKDLMYAFFYLSSLIMYLRYLQSGQRKYYLYVLPLFICAFLSKTTAVTLPVVLFAFDFYFRRTPDLKVFLEKIPLFVLSVVAGLVFIYAQKAEGSIPGENGYTFFDRLLIANYSFVTYALKQLMPFDLKAYYPYPQKVNGLLPSYFWFYPLLVAALFSAAIFSFRYTRKIVFALAFFCITVALVLQLLPSGGAIMAERYSYIPSIAIFYLLAEGAMFLLKKNKNLKWPVIACVGIMAAYFFSHTHTQCRIWKDSLTLWNAVINRHQDIYIAYYNRGSTLGKMGKLDEALDDYNHAVVLNPGFGDTYNNRGIVLAMKGRLPEAIADFTKSIGSNSKNKDSFYNRGLAYFNTQQKDKACADFVRAKALGHETAARALTDLCK